MKKILKHLYLRQDQCKKLEELAGKELSQAEIVRCALDHYFKQLKNKSL